MDFRLMFLIILLGIGNISLKAQDIHFSQTQANPLFLNPALTGVIPTDYRLVIVHRSQWNTFTNAYKTVAASFDHKQSFRRFPFADLGLGFSILSDRAGDGNYGNTSFFVPLSLQKKLVENKLMVSLGLQASVGQYSVDFNKLYWGTQYNGKYFDPGLPSTEVFQGNNVSYFDFSYGVAGQYDFGYGRKLTTGYSLFHVNNPSISFSDETTEDLPIRESLFISGVLPMSSQFVLHPGFYSQRQASNSESIVGAQLQFLPSLEIIQDFRAGMYYRFKDAIILETSFVFKELNIGLSYDFTVSKLTRINNGLGGFEISITYQFNINRPLPYYPPKYCPDFI